jgi:ribosomal protein S12 methylthiotransferase accessory factor
MFSDRLSNLYDLCQPEGGLIGRRTLFWPEDDEPCLAVQTAQVGDLSGIWNRGGDHASLSASGSGVGLDAEEGSVPALAEAVERYCAGTYSNDQFVWASAAELGSEALDLDTIPRCSTAELGNSACPLVIPDKSARIRWVRGLSLTDGQVVLIPAVMVYLFAGFASRAERICLPITTGCAAHTNYEDALVAAILEVVERDAISLVWLQRLPLFRIEIDQMTPRLAQFWARYEASSNGIEHFFFDATLDLGLPTIYGLQISRNNRRLTTLLSCSSALDPSQALTKVLCDMAALRIAFRVPRPTPKSYESFTDVFHGASYMARAENFSAFEFLLAGSARRRLSEIRTFGVMNGRSSQLRAVLELLRRERLDAYAIDLTTDEAQRHGLRVVRVIIPGLQPLSFHYRARYLGHKRLYEGPAKMGYRVHSEENLNSWPQPFC